MRYIRTKTVSDEPKLEYCYPCPDPKRLKSLSQTDDAAGGYQRDWQHERCSTLLFAQTRLAVFSTKSAPYCQQQQLLSTSVITVHLQL